MTSDVIQQLLSIVDRKQNIDSNSDWSNGAITYLNELRSEIDEVSEEMDLNRNCYLEDELADVLWDYLNLLVCLKEERSIQPDRVFQRAVVKYQQRIGGLEQGRTWAEIKEEQKLALELELERQ